MLSIYNIVFMYVFKADHLALDNELVFSFPEKTVFPSLIILELPVVFV